MSQVGAEADKISLEEAATKVIADQAQVRLRFGKQAFKK